jgi:hypothetical protein
MKKALIQLQTVVYLFSLFFFLIVSCNTRNVSKSTSILKKDSTEHQYKDTFEVKKTIKKETVKKDSSKTKKTSEKSGVKIDFDKKDTTKATGPIVITKKGDSIIVDPGGRKVVGVKTNKKSETKDGIKASFDNTVTSSTNDSTGSTSGKTTAVHTESKITQKEIKTKRVPWLSLFPLLLIVLVVVAYKYRKKISFISTLFT